MSWRRKMAAIAAATVIPLLTLTAEPPCVRQLELSFFNPVFVDEALSMHGVFQSSWSLINTELQNRVRRVPEIVRDRAKRMSPNPFGTPFQARAASEIMRQALFEVFSETLAYFNITNQSQVEEMFRYIRERQSQRILSCFGPEIEEIHN